MKTAWWIAFLLVASASGPGTARAGYSFRLEPATGVDLRMLHVGQSFQVGLVVDFDPGEQISYFRLTEFLGGTLLQLTGIDPGAAIPSGGSFTGNGSRTSFEAAYSGFTPISAPGTLAVVTLTAIRAGSGMFSLGGPTFFGPSTADPVDFSGLTQAYTINDVTPDAMVPEPPSIVLGVIALALGASAWLRRSASLAPATRAGGPIGVGAPRVAR